MRFLGTLSTALALSAFALAPASACPWAKTTEMKTDMTVADATVFPDVDQDVAIATNDLREPLAKDLIETLPEDTQAEK